MRLWHKDLISILPRQQLLGQWRECCLIAKELNKKGTPNHLLVNKIITYPISHFIFYINLVKTEMLARGYKIHSNIDFVSLLQNFIKDQNTQILSINELFKDWHNNRYLYQCLFNLQEKFDCGGISKSEWLPIRDFIMKHYEDWNIDIASTLYLYK